jgi:uncharacterized membrane protein YdjX (TVP38/TMEM64 family)
VATSGPPPDPRLARQRWRLGAGLALVAAAVGSFAASLFVIDWDRVLVGVQQRRQELHALAHDHPLAASAVYFLAYVLFTSLALPGAVILTLIGGAVFGLWWGVLLVSFASTLGATLAFLASRYLLRDWVQARYGERLAAVNRELDREGAFYLFALRLNPVIPFFLINLLFGLTRMPAGRFWWVSQLGMLPATVIYTNAGARLAEVASLRDIVSGEVLGSLVALSLFPLAARKVVEWWRARKA